MTPPTGHLSTPPGSIVPAGKLSGRIEVRSTHRATGEVQTHNVQHPFALLGRAPQAGVRLDDPSVSQCHAYLQLVDGVPYCLDLGSRTGVLWDDGTQSRGWVHSGQTIRVGNFDVQIDGVGGSPAPAPHDPDEAARAPLATFDVHAPLGASGRFTLDQPVTFVGKHPNCALRFLEKTIAYFQCAIVKTREGVACVDILSRAGTVVNGRPVRFAHLRDGDLLEFGKVSLLLRIGPAAEQPLTLLSANGFHPAPAIDQLGAVVNPLREMMEQFQECFGTMARMFMTMQQEHTAMMCEQMRQVQDLLRESRGTVAPAQLAPPVSPGAAPAGPPASPAAKPVVPKAVSPDEARQLVDAHTWFLERLKQKPTAPANGKPKPAS